MSKKWKKCLEISSFNTSVLKIMIICYIALDICHMADVVLIFHHALRKGLVLYWLNLNNNSNQRLCLFRQKQILRSSRHKNLQNQNNEVFFGKYNTIYRMKCNANNKTQSFHSNVIKGCYKIISIIIRLLTESLTQASLFVRKDLM